MSPTPSVRKAVLLGVPLLSLVVVVLSSVVLTGQLPAEIPSTWQGGTATDTMELVPYTGFMVVLVTVIGLAMQALRHRVGEPTSQRVLGAAGAGVPAGIAVLHLGILLSVRGQEPPFTAPVAAFVTAGLVALAVGSLAAAVVRPVERHGAPIAPEPLQVEPGEAVVWTGGSTAPWWSWGTVAAAFVVAGALALADLLWVALLLALVAAAAMTLLKVNVTVGPGGITARMGLLRLVRFQAELGEITAVHAEVIDPLTYGGWGLRWLPGVRGVVLRTGPGVRVEQDKGPDLVVTVDGAAEAAGVLLAHMRAAGVG